MAKTLTPGPFAAQMVGEFCIPVLVGKAKEPAPVQGAWLTPAQRRQFNLPAGGRTVAYDLGDSYFVFLDIQNNRTQMWFAHPDAGRSLKLVEDALKRAAPKLKQIHDVERTRPGLRTRAYEGELSKSVIAQVEIVYPDPKDAGAAQNLFMVCVYGLVEPGGSDPLPAIKAMSETLAKKKK
jgi:hypothetical protein